MKEQNLEIIKDRTLVLKQGETSNELKLVDPHGDDMFLTFELKYISGEGAGFTRIKAPDSQHANIIIETRPNAVTEPEDYIELGTYSDGTPLYIGFVVQPQIAQSGLHNVIITFYKGKEVTNGANNN